MEHYSAIFTKPAGTRNNADAAQRQNAEQKKRNTKHATWLYGFISKKYKEAEPIYGDEDQNRSYFGGQVWTGRGHEEDCDLLETF